MALLNLEWLNDIYETLAVTLNNTEHNLNTGITQQVFGNELIQASTINTLMTSIQSLNTNYYLNNYADCFINNDPLNTVSAGGLISSQTKNEIDNYINEMLLICANRITSNGPATGCVDTSYTHTFRAASGCTDKGNDFSARSGCTDKGNDFSARSGCTDKGNDFSAATRSGHTNFGRDGNNFSGSSRCVTFVCGDSFSCNFDHSFSVGAGFTQCEHTRRFSGFTNARVCSTFTFSARGNTNSATFGTDGNCGFSAASGCTDKGNDFTAASGCTDKGNDFSAASGCTDKTNNFSAASGNTNLSFTTTFQEFITIRTDFSVKNGKATVSHSNFN